MIVAIRISGQVGLSKPIGEALFRLRLRRKYSAVLLESKPTNLKLLKKLRNYLAYGDITKEDLLELIKKRAMAIEKSKKIDAEKIAIELEKKRPESLGIKPFFRLHPPRGGIESKKHCGVGKGVLGDNKSEINTLLRRML